jgi:DNA-binding transcriptional ArsR family regulator
MRRSRVLPAYFAGTRTGNYDIIKTMKMSEAVTVLNALAQESRLAILRYLIRSGPSGVPAGLIGERLEVHAATLSFHLNALRQAGLVIARRESRSIIYTADFVRMSDLIGYLTENCCRGEASPECRPGVLDTVASEERVT